MKQQADRHRSERKFAIGDLVFVRLHSYAQRSISKGNSKFQPHYYGPFPILDKIGKVAYKLQLPSDALIHNVFHVSLLKPASASIVASSSLPPISQHSTAYPQAILDRRMVKRGNVASTQLLVHWKDSSPADSTWEFADELRLRFPTFSLGTRKLKGGSIVMN